MDASAERGCRNDFNEFIDDSEKVVAKAHQENHELPVFMPGDSMGGFIAASRYAQYSSRLSGQILSGAASGIQSMQAGGKAPISAPRPGNPWQTLW
jgi:alpha-beta hydrolase superfamily lysophospholipase